MLNFCNFLDNFSMALQFLFVLFLFTKLRLGERSKATGLALKRALSYFKTKQKSLSFKTNNFQQFGMGSKKRIP